MRLYRLCICLALALPFLAAGQAYVVINEVLTDNSVNSPYTVPMANEAGNFGDWIEIYNPSELQYDLSGQILMKGNPQYERPWDPWDPGYLTNQNFYVFPSDTYLDPNTYLIVWCDKDLTNSVTNYHTGWGLEKVEGDMVMLVDRDGMTILDYIGFGMQLTDLSISRVPDGSANWTLTVPTPYAQNQPVQLGLRSGIKINEWNPTNASCWGGHCNDDWIELYNPSTNHVALGNLLLTTDLTIPPMHAAISNLSFIEAGGFLRLWAMKNDANAANEVNFGLSHQTGETVTMYDADDPTFSTIYDQISFAGQAVMRWATTNYVTNVICGTTCITNRTTNYAFLTQGRLPDGDTNNPYMIFPQGKATPGESNFLPLTNVLVTEILAHTDPPLQDVVELYNPTTNAADLSGFYLSNSKNNARKYQFPSNTFIPPLGYLTVYEYQFNWDWGGGTNDPRCFTFNSAGGDQCYIYSASNNILTGYRRAVDFSASENSISFGRYINASTNADFVPMPRLTFGSAIDGPGFPTNSVTSNAFVLGRGAANLYPKVGPLVITEIMYHPLDNWGWVTNQTPTNTTIVWTNIDNSLDEYVEIYNMSTNSVNLWQAVGPLDHEGNHWSIDRTIEFALPQITLGPGEFMLLVNFPITNTTQEAYFRNLYHVPGTFANIYGQYKGKLQNNGGTIQLIKPDWYQAHGQYSNTFPRLVVEKIEYNDKLPWPTNADGIVYPGNTNVTYSLSKVVPELYGNDATNWVAAAPTPGWHPRTVRFQSAIQSNNTVVISFTGWAGSAYTVQRNSSCTATTGWTKVDDVAARPTSSEIRQVTDTITPGTTRFYRVVPLQP